MGSLQKIRTNKAKRVGRGYGSGKGGHTAARGSKGQNSRSGGKRNIYFEGGQTPLVKRMPFRGGFTNHNAKRFITFNLSDLESIISKESEINIETLVNAGLIETTKFDAVKILSRGQISKKVKFNGFIYSESAKAKIEKAGGTAN